MPRPFLYPEHHRAPPEARITPIVYPRQAVFLGPFIGQWKLMPGMGPVYPASSTVPNRRRQATMSPGAGVPKPTGGDYSSALQLCLVSCLIKTSILSKYTDTLEVLLVLLTNRSSSQQAQIISNKVSPHKHKMLRRIPASASASGSVCSRLSTLTRMTTRSRASVATFRHLSTTPTRNMASQNKVPSPLTATLPSDSFHLLAEAEKPGPPEDALYEQQIKDVEAWWATSRYAGIKRPYTAADVVSKRGSLQQSYPCSLMARKLWDMIQNRLSKGEPLHTSTHFWPSAL